MGAFSEVLGKFNKQTHTFETMSLAGTLPVSENWSEKEIEEQKPVSSYIRNILKTIPRLLKNQKPTIIFPEILSISELILK